MSTPIESPRTAPSLERRQSEEAPPADGGAPTTPIFEDPENQGVDPTGDTPQVDAEQDPDAPPDQVAAYVKWENAGTNSERGRIAYLQALYVHRDDPEWLAGFYAQLGPEATASLIAQTTDPFTHSLIGAEGGDPEMAQLQTQAIQESLNTLYASGHLDEQSLTALLNAFPNNDSLVYAATEIFAGADGGLQELFFTAAAGSDNPTLNAGALHVLNTLSSDRQQALLTGLGDGLDGFIARAMAGEREMPAFADAVRFGMHTGMLLDNGTIEPVTYGGIETLLETANNVTVYYHARTSVPNFDAGLQADLFSAVSLALNNGGTFDKLRDSAAFKQELSTLFINNSQAILHEHAPDGAFADPSFIEGMTKFFEITLFTQNPGENRDTLMQHMLTTMGDVGDASVAPSLPREQYEAEHAGWSQQDHVEVMGGLQGMVLQAADNQKSYLEAEILKDREQRQAMIGFVTGMAFAFAPGASEVFEGLSETGGNWLSQVPSTITEFVYDETRSQLEKGSQEVLLNLLSEAGNNEQALADINAFMDTFKDTIMSTSAVLPNGEEGELNLRTSFQSAYAFYRDLVSF